jgi:putative redox protein
MAETGHHGVPNSRATSRRVTIKRLTTGTYVVTNDRGGELRIGTGQGTDFTPVDLLLAALGGCTAVDVDLVTSRRAEPDEFTVQVDGEKVRDADGNRLTDLAITFHVTFPATAEGDEARAILPDIVRKSHDRLCSVGRTVELGTPVATRIG